MSKIKTKWIPSKGQSYYYLDFDYGYFYSECLLKIKKTERPFAISENAFNMNYFKCKYQAESVRKAIIKILRGEK
jgi:hypothetical protein